MSDPTYRLLLELAGRVDDDLLATGRELVAVGEEGHALELLVAELVAGRVVLPPAVRSALVTEAAARRIQPDADRGLPPGGSAADDLPHRFTGDGPAGQTPELAAALAEVTAPGDGWTLAWRVTPAGAAPGPLPQPVLLGRAGDDGSAEVLTYQAQYALSRDGLVASVEVHDDGDPDTSYHRAARAVARPLPAGPVASDGRRPEDGEPPAGPAPGAGPDGQPAPDQRATAGPESQHAAGYPAQPVRAADEPSELRAGARPATGGSAEPQTAGAPDAPEHGTDGTVEPTATGETAGQGAAEQHAVDGRGAAPVAGPPHPVPPPPDTPGPDGASAGAEPPGRWRPQGDGRGRADPGPAPGPSTAGTGPIPTIPPAPPPAPAGHHLRTGDLPSSTGAGPAPGAGTFDAVVPGPGGHRPGPGSAPAAAGPVDGPADTEHPAPRPSPPVRALRRSTGDWFDADDHPRDDGSTDEVPGTGTEPPSGDGAAAPGGDRGHGRAGSEPDTADGAPHGPPAVPAADEDAWQQDWASGAWIGDVTPAAGPAQEAGPLPTADGAEIDAPTPPPGVPIAYAPPVPASALPPAGSPGPRHLLLTEGSDDGDAGDPPPAEDSGGAPEPAPPAVQPPAIQPQPTGGLADRLSPTEHELLQRLHEELASRETGGESTPRNGTARPDRN